jgi:carboxypeptidase family protein/PDZ domain-containing protein
MVTRRDGALDVSVHDGAGGPSLAGAHVRVLAVIGDRAYLAGAGDTLAGGEAHLADLPRGELWVLVDKVGHARASAHIALGAERRSLTFDLAPAHTLKVAVHDELSAPLVDAEIEIVSATDPLPVGARTGTDGTVEVSRLGAGPWHLMARQVGFDDATARAESEGEVVAMVLHKLGALVVHVSQADGRDASHALVTVAGATLWPARSVETDDHGDVRIGNLGLGTYALRASRGDAVSPIEPAISVGRGEEAKVELRLAPGRFVNVRVTDGEGDDAAPIARARVTVAEEGLSPFPLEAATDAKGRARLGPIASGPVTVGARADGFVARGAIAIADAPTIETQVALVRAGIVTGRVVDGRGDPVDGATIEIFGTDPMGGPILDDPRRSSFQAAHFDAMLGGPTPLVPSGELGVMPGPVPPIPSLSFNAALTVERVAIDADPWVTRADGTFRASPASPGRIRALVRHPQFVEAQSDVVTLTPGGEVELQVVMHQGGSLEGRVVDSNDRPVPSARVFVSATRGTLERTTRTASDGTFAFAALPQSVTLGASADDDETPDVRMTLDVPEGGRQEVTVQLPAPRSPLVVTVVDEHGASVVAAQVSGRSLSVAAPLRVTAFTDDRGEAVLKRARGVPLRVEVTAPSRAPQFVVTDASSESVRVALAPAELLTGEIVSARGRDPIAGAEVALHLEWGVRRARTDSEGRFALRDLPAGGARLAVRAPGFAALEEAVTVAETGGRRESNLDRIELVEEGVVEGEVVDGRGDPVTGARVAQGLAPTWLLVGSTPSDVAVTDAQGRFRLRELAEGTIAVEAYSPDLGRGRVDGVSVVAGRTTDRVRVVIERNVADAGEPGASGGVAVTLGETGAPTEVVVVSVAEGSEAERGGMAAGDVLLAIDDSPVSTLEGARARLSGPLADDVVLRLRRADKTLLLRVARDAVRR